MSGEITIICFSIVLIVLFVISARMVQRYILLNKYKIVIELFDYFLNMAWNVIYSDQLIAFTSEGITKGLPKEEIETIERNFIKLTLEIMGNRNEEMITSFFGDESTMINNMLIFFRSKLEGDTLAAIVRNKPHE